MSMLLNGHASLTAMMALRFEKALGISAATLLRMQVSYDLAQVKLGKRELVVARLQRAA